MHISTPLLLLLSTTTLAKSTGGSSGGGGSSGSSGSGVDVPNSSSNTDTDVDDTTNSGSSSSSSGSSSGSSINNNNNNNNKAKVRTSDSSGYVYYGCYNETTGLANTSGFRALSNGKSLVKPGGMTVDTCWDFCKTGAGDSSGGKNGRFEFAGLEYARECWCAQSLSSLSKKVDDSECNLPCEGNKNQVCGGNLKLTVYRAGAAAARVAWAAGLVAVGAISLSLL